MPDSYDILKSQLRGKDPEIIKRAAAMELAKTSTRHKLENFFWIKTKAGILQLMSPLKEPQLKLLRLYEYCKEHKIPPRIIILKARKTGVSTFWEAILLLEAMERGIDALVIAHDKETAEYIFSIAHRFYSHYNLDKPEIGVPSARRMKFKDQEGLVVVQTAGNAQAGTGMTPQFIHASEVAKWDKGSETAVALFQSIGDSPETAVILESTAQSFDSLFYPYWVDSEKYCKVNWTKQSDGDWKVDLDIKDPGNWNGYIPFFIAWFEDPENTRKFFNQEQKRRFVLDDYEKMLIRRFHVSLEQLLWRRYTIRNKCQNDIKIFRQEHPSTPKEAFVSSGRPFLDQDILDMMPIEDGRQGYLSQHDRWEREIFFQESKTDFVHIYRSPEKQHRYALGVDIAEGLLPEGARDPDESVAIVLDIDSGFEQVATIAGHIGEDELASRVVLLAQYYNMAFVVPEVMGYGQHVAIRLGDGESYPRELIYRRMDFLSDSKRRSKQIGWKTTSASRPILLGDLKQAVADKAILLHDERTIEQCKRLEYGDKGKVMPASGHDDHCFALALALQGAKHFPQNIWLRYYGEGHKTIPHHIRQIYDPQHRLEQSNPDDITGY